MAAFGTSETNGYDARRSACRGNVLQNYFHDQNEQYESGTSTSAQRRFKNTVHLDSIVARSKRSKEFCNTIPR
jgi:hypothetical protein